MSKKMRKILLILMCIVLIISAKAYGEEIKTKDIGSLQFNSLSVGSISNIHHLSFLVKANRIKSFGAIIDVKDATQKSIEYFFVGLIMPDDRFWVNLNPNEPDRIVDFTLGNTDIGKVMLIADFRLKEDMCNLTNPKTSEIGKIFWQRLYKQAEKIMPGYNVDIPTMTRLWIVPDEVEVYDTENEVYITKCKLRVELESEYLSRPQQLSDKKQKMLQDYAANLMRELILPKLNEKVNDDLIYADLRQVFHSLILARWYRQRVSYRHGSLVNTVDSRVLTELDSAFDCSPQDVYQDYLKSVKEGEYSFDEETTYGNSFYMIRETKHYFSGGVDFRNIWISQTTILPNELEDKDSYYFSCDLFIPQGVGKPLQYAKNGLELATTRPKDYLQQQQDSGIALANNLPAIAPVRFAQENIQTLEQEKKIEIVLLSKL